VWRREARSAACETAPSTLARIRCAQRWLAAVKGAREMRRPRGTYYASALGRGGFDRHLALALALSQHMPPHGPLRHVELSLPPIAGSSTHAKECKPRLLNTASAELCCTHRLTLKQPPLCQILGYSPPLPRANDVVLWCLPCPARLPAARCSTPLSLPPRRGASSPQVYGLALSRNQLQPRRPHGSVVRIRKWDIKLLQVLFCGCSVLGKPVSQRIVEIMGRQRGSIWV